jgi:hypothetical protein
MKNKSYNQWNKLIAIQEAHFFSFWQNGKSDFFGLLFMEKGNQ